MVDIFWFASHTPVEVAQLVIGYLRSFRSIAYLNKAWHAAVRGLADLLYARFLHSKFSVDMLHDDMGRGLFAARHADIRLIRLLHTVAIKDPKPHTRFWYMAQLHLHRFCGANGNTALRDILLHCGRNSDIGKSYDFRQLLPEGDELATDSRDVRGCMSLCEDSRSRLLFDRVYSS